MNHGRDCCCTGCVADRSTPAAPDLAERCWYAAWQACEGGRNGTDAMTAIRRVLAEEQQRREAAEHDQICGTCGSAFDTRLHRACPRCAIAGGEERMRKMGEAADKFAEFVGQAIWMNAVETPNVFADHPGRIPRGAAMSLTCRCGRMYSSGGCIRCGESSERCFCPHIAAPIPAAAQMLRTQIAALTADLEQARRERDEEKARANQAEEATRAGAAVVLRREQDFEGMREVADRAQRIAKECLTERDQLRAALEGIQWNGIDNSEEAGSCANLRCAGDRRTGRPHDPDCPVGLVLGGAK